VLSVSGDYGIVNQIEFQGRSFAGVSVSNYGVVRTGDVVYTKSPLNSNPYGIIKTNKGKTGIVSTLYAVYRPKENTYPDFVQTYFEQHARMNNYMHPLVNKGAKNDMKVSSENALKGYVIFPNYEEQKAISEYFAVIDDLITLHQRMCVFFGSMVRIRMDSPLAFAWEQRKFSDITYPAGEKNRENLPLESYSITNESGFVPQNEQFENGGTMREADKRMYYIVSPNSFAYNPARINVGSIGYQNTAKNVIVSSLYEVFKTTEDIDDRLLWHWFKSPDFQKLIVQLQEGGVRLYFYYDKLCMGEVALPEIEEQRKIGQFHDTLDTLITLHQRKLKHTKNNK
jgi:restriction endonuclease S subunit